ncbi:MAG: hypothetical protein R3F60_02880 [bacterium]
MTGQMGKEVAFHTHFNHASEIPAYSKRAGSPLRRGVTVATRPCCCGVNDTLASMTLLVRRLAWINAHPYCVTTSTTSCGGGRTCAPPSTRR